jgi:hypothetical protein
LYVKFMVPAVLIAAFFMALSCLYLVGAQCALCRGVAPCGEACTRNLNFAQTDTQLATFLKFVDFNSMNHIVGEKEAQTRVSTPAGGGAFLSALVLVVSGWAMLIFSFFQGNSGGAGVRQDVLLGLDNAAWQATSVFSWRAVQPANGNAGLSNTALLLRVTGACKPNAASFSGLTEGAWVQLLEAPSPKECAFESTTYSCVNCRLGSNSVVNLALPPNCTGDLLLEAAAQPPQSGAELSAAFAVLNGVGSKAWAWSTGPVLFNALQAPPGSLTGGQSASRYRGYSFTFSPEDASSTPVGVVGGVRGTVAVRFPTLPVYVVSQVSNAGWVQLLANIVGLFGLLGACGGLFRLSEHYIADNPPACARRCLGAAGQVGRSREGGFTLAAITGITRDVKASLQTVLQRELETKLATERELRQRVKRDLDSLLSWRDDFEARHSAELEELKLRPLQVSETWGGDVPAAAAAAAAATAATDPAAGPTSAAVAATTLAMPSPVSIPLRQWRSRAGAEPPPASHPEPSAPDMPPPPQARNASGVNERGFFEAALAAAGSNPHMTLRSDGFRAPQMWAGTTGNLAAAAAAPAPAPAPANPAAAPATATPSASTVFVNPMHQVLHGEGIRASNLWGGSETGVDPSPAPFFPSLVAQQEQQRWLRLQEQQQGRLGGAVALYRSERLG